MSTEQEKLEARFWKKVEKTDSCWLWKGSDDGSAEGYGKFWDGGMSCRAHRVSYKWYHGDIMPGMVIRHSCDNPRCVRPDHLSQGTRKENMEDMVARGRSTKGRSQPTRKLTTAQAAEIYSSTESIRALARNYNMYPTSIRAIKNGETYKAATQTLLLLPSSPVPSDEETAYIASPPPTPSRIEPCEQA